MDKTVTLELNIFGKVHEFAVSEDFEMGLLEQYCTLQNVKSSDGIIYAKVSSLQKPYSAMLKDIQSILARWRLFQWFFNTFYDLDYCF